METEVEGVKKKKKKTVFLLKFLKKRPSGSFGVITGYGFGKTWSKIMCEYQSQTSVLSQFLRVGLVGKGDGINLVSILLKWVGAHRSYSTCLIIHSSGEGSLLAAPLLHSRES